MLEYCWNSTTDVTKSQSRTENVLRGIIRTMGVVIAIILRLVVPLTILRLPLVGGLLALALDSWENYFIDAIGGSGNGFYYEHYHTIDKSLDMYYLSLEFLVSLRWTNRLAKNTSIALFVWRVLGFVFFEITRLRLFLVIFANVFENFFLFYVVAGRFFPRAQPVTFPQLILLLFILSIPKFVQEYILHIKYLGWHGFLDIVLSPP